MGNGVEHTTLGKADRARSGKYEWAGRARPVTRGMTDATAK